MEGFTVISGPNGSGKSNIIDSLLFVLCLATSSSLRAEKLTDLINTNSGKNHSEVKVTFSDGTTIRRRVKRSENGYYSYYYLNERPSTQTEILQLLSKHGIKPEGYNVVMQGEITRIMEMGNVERRRIIDEIAGVAEFDQKREQALSELEIVRERIEREEIVLRELESRLKELEKERERAEEHRRLQEELSGLEAAKTAARLRGLEREHAALLQLIGEQKKELLELERERASGEAALGNARSGMAAVEEELARKSGPDYMALVGSIEEKKGEIRACEQGIERLEREKTAAEEELNRVFMDLRRAEARVKEISDQLRTMNIDRANLAMDLAAKKAALENAERSIAGKGQEAEEAKGRLFQLMEEIERGKEARASLIRERDAHLERNRIRTSEMERIEGLLSRAGGDGGVHRTQLQGCLSSLAEKRKEKGLLDAEIAGTEQRLFSARASLDQLRKEIRSLEQELIRVEAQQQVKGEGEGRAQEAVLGMDGVCGTIAMLGKAPKEYALALDVAAGARLSYVVTRDDQVAADAIRYLKENRIGRLTFLPLNRMRPPPLPELKEQGVVGYAVRLLEFERKYEPAFRVVLGQTVVVDTLERARSLMGKYRMVTLDGELVEKTGAMTGGIYRRTRGFGVSAGDEAVRLSGLLAKAQSDAGVLEEAVRSLTVEAERSRERRSALAEEIARLDAMAQEAEKREREQESERRELGERLDAYRREVEEGAKALVELEERIGELNARVAALVAESERLKASMEATEIPRLAAEMERQRQEVADLERRLRNKDSDISDLQRERQYFLKRTEELARERARILEKQKAADEEIAGMKSRIEENRHSIGELQERMKSFSEELSELRQQRDRILEELRGEERSLAAIGANMERIGLQVKALEERAGTMEAEIQAARAQCTVQVDSDLTLEEIERRLSDLGERLRRMGAVNMLAIEEHDRVRARIEERSSRKETLSIERTNLIERIQRFEQMKYDSFMAAFRAIDANFREIFARLTNGSGHLVLENEEDPFGGGLTFAVHPQEKKIHLLSSLSGGEKSIVTLSFIFAIQKYMPAPFYAMDEIDMFLDGTNVERVAGMIGELSANAQSILVSLRKPMIERADRILGVAIRPDKSTLVTGVRMNGRGAD